ncbi:SET domain-containing protein [Reichenbachiella ulvae]|uniref:SET domain-containing protein n=1 Tax=Reichenbachiella ulvae TaxID=2980104 RepID=A0ABT3CNR3_9BACT|nr:SET domain-containing protein [Reichenbachiella ulvae]MCV9385385.1 SET domain-containing protein [Reichenbachiella ulvae]
MIHPKTKLQHINEVVGYGVFATERIPKGTIVYIKDSLEHIIVPEVYHQHDAEMKAVIDKYSYIDEHGNRIVSWDFAKYVNHCCNCNTMSTGYGFEIAIRDVEAGEEITDEYGIFNIDQEMELICSEPTCRKKIALDDFERYYEKWDDKIVTAIFDLWNVDQPLINLLDEKTQKEIEMLRNDPASYKSVYALKYHPQPQLHLNGQQKTIA